MTKLQDAAAVYMGDAAASSVMLGASQVWEYIAPALLRMFWGATSIYGDLAGDTVSAFAPGSTSQAAFTYGEAPLSGKVYFEADIRSDAGGSATSTGVGIAAFDGVAVPTTGIGAAATELDLGSNATSAFAYSNGTQVVADTPAHAYVEPATFRFGIYVDVPARAVWARQIYPGGPGAFLNGGDPVAGTDPIITVPGSDPIYPACSVRGDSNAYAKLVTAPADFVDAPLTGYSAPATLTTRIAVSGTMAAGAVGDGSGSGYTAGGGTGPHTFIHAGTVPGITFNADGTRSGTYTLAGTYVHVTTAIDANGQLGQLREEIVVEAAAEPGAISIGAHGFGTFNGMDYPYDGAQITLDTQATGSGFLVYAVFESGHPGAVSCSDSMGNSYTLLSGATGAGAASRSYLFWSPGGAGGAGHIFTFHGPTDEVLYATAFAVEIVGDGLVVDQYADALDTAAPLVSPTITPTSAGQMVVAFTGGRTGTAITVAAPFSLLDEQINTAGPEYYTGASAFSAQDTAAAIAAAWTQSGNAYALNHIVSIKKV